LINVAIVAGEASGDLHASKLVAEMKRLHPALNFFGIGGDKMALQGVELLEHCGNLAFMGFVEVVKHLPTVNRVMRKVLGEIRRRDAKLVILVDYPGFNLKLAGKLKLYRYFQSPKIFYYISPQVWAWGKGRIPKIARLVDRMVGILPFESEVYSGSDLDFHFVGHPLLDELVRFTPQSDFFEKYGLKRELPLIALLPGSRTQVIVRNLPVMIASREIIAQRIDGQFAIAGVKNIDSSIYLPVKKLPLIYDDAYDLIAHSVLALTSSGTATLETALIGTPMVVMYKMNPVSYLLAKNWVELKHIALPNVIAGEGIVPELIQNQATPGNLAEKAMEILNNPEHQSRQKTGFEKVRKLLGEAGVSKRAAELAVDLL
jgi:lipid-A-disaccharide synthase